jgi:hypothetical protein
MKTAGYVLVILLVMMSCSGQGGMDKYTRLVKKELTENKRVDSLFFGIYFGMSKKSFFNHCWEMNKKGIFTDGNDGLGNMYVLYKPGIELKHPASMNFYPDFTDSTISEMHVSFQYAGWAPWNKHLYADSLLPDVLNLYKKWYSDGNPFILIDDKIKGTIYVKVDGNRRITIGKYNDMLVKVNYTDMLTEKKIKK